MEKKAILPDEARFLLEERRITCISSEKVFTITYGDGSGQFCLETEVALIPIRSVKRKSKSTEDNLLEIMVFTADERFCEIIQIHAQEFERHHGWPE